MTFESYKEMCKKHKIKNPYNTEDEYYRAYPPLEVVKKEVPKVVKTVQPTLGVNIINNKKIRIAKPDVPKRTYQKRTSDWKRPSKSGRVIVAPRVSMKGLTAKEIREHKNRLNRERIARDKPTKGTPYSRHTAEQREAYNKARIKHYHANRDEVLAKNKAKYSLLTDEQRQAKNEAMRAWRASLTPEVRSAMNKRARDAKKLKKLEKQNEREYITG
jgi:hypothetical protein